MKLMVTEKFYDKKESIYVEKDKVIERDDDRAQELIEAGVVVPAEDEKPEVQEETSGDDEAPAEEPEDEKPEKGKGKAKKTK